MQRTQSTMKFLATGGGLSILYEFKIRHCALTSATLYRAACD